MAVNGMTDGLRRFVRRIRLVLNPGLKAELEEELRFHVEQATEANVAAGMSEGEARRRALVDFGGVEKAREESWRERPGWFLETVFQDVRYAVRGFRRNPAFAVTLVVTLALGIGATTAVFSVVDRILFRALPFADGERLVSVGLTAPIVPQEFMLGGSYYEWRDNQKPFEAFTSEAGVAECDLTERNPARLNCASVEGNFLPTLGIAPLLGRNFLPEEDRPNGPKAALISYALWKGHYGGDAGVLNRLIRIDGAERRVVGVLPREFEMPTLEPADIVLPQALDEAAQRKADPGRVMYAFARLRPGVSPEQASAQLDPVFQYSLNLAPPAFRKEVHLLVRTVRDRQMKKLRLTAWVLFGAVLAVLLIACANVASLMIARGIAREREVAVRSALGASRGRLIRQSITEALLLAMAAALAGWALAEGLLRVFVALAPGAIPFLDKARLDIRIAGFTVLLAGISGVAFGILSGFERSSSIGVATLQRNSAVRSRLRGVMVVGQIAVSMVLLTASALLVQSFWNLHNENLGMRTRSLVTAGISLGRENYDTAQKQMQFFAEAEARLQRLPGVTAVGVSDSLPPAGEYRQSILNVMEVSGKPRAQNGTGGMVAMRWVTPDYFRTLGIPIVEGRGFSEGERQGTEHLMIVSRLLEARLFPGESAVGQHIRPSPNDSLYTVVGVAKDVKNAGLTGDDVPEYYRLRRNVVEDWLGNSAVLVVETSLGAEALSGAMRAEIAHIDPTVPVEIETLEGRVGKLADGPRFDAALLGFFALCALLMAVTGLYGLIAYMAQRRTNEIGVRIALGASRGEILRLIAGEGVRLVAIGCAVGVVAAYSVMQVLGSLLFNVTPRDPVILVAVGVVLAVVSIVAALIPARAAMGVDPVVALRCE